MNRKNPHRAIMQVPAGYSKVRYNGQLYGLTKTLFNSGMSIKIYAEQLGGSDFISFNYYQVCTKAILKACEMPEEKVLAFLENYRTFN